MMKLKRFVPALCTALTCLLLLTGCGGDESSADSTKTAAANTGNTLQAVKEKGVLVVASSNDAPFAYLDAKNNNAFSGIDADIITEIAKRLGIAKVEMKHVPFENLLIELNNGTVDMVTDAMYIKPERLSKAYFTNQWYREGEAVVIKKDSAIKTKEDLKDKTIGGQKGMTFLETAQKWQQEGKVKEVKVFNSQAELMMAVNTGKIDACITDGIVAGYTLKQNADLALRILEPYEPESSGVIGAAIRFADKDLLAAVNDELEKMRADGTLKAIYDKYNLPENYRVLDAAAAATPIQK
ncbi:substrate-binding periplasmic protein [Selenomonas ruminantium]|uniref:Amino acid ABC transporter substrate-binding protein, PAAT family n=1 Tax=Selenomonas ruminantium TaxID=971 RepID=A0A1H0NM82_SELRU|nr:ABC transporter substrate-binding protein [Selenomonas ruminantium]SDO93668.1 amino acid ABC transporter substrate-binding protein, PAAT family [Selenomonas ruminantium]